MLRMRSYVAVACLALAAAATAQFRNNFAVAGDYNPVILGAPAVQKELHLTAAQVSGFQKQFQAIVSKQMGGFRNQPGQKPDEAKREAAQKAVGLEIAKTTNNFAKTLKPEQRKRWHELTLQMSGPAALTQDSVAKAVGVSDAQKSKIKKVVDDARSKMMAGRQGGGGGTGGPGGGRNAAGGGRNAGGQGAPGGPGGQRPDRAKMEKMRADRDAAIVKVLSSVQQAKWKALLGKPFPRDQMRPPAPVGMGAARNK